MGDYGMLRVKLQGSPSIRVMSRFIDQLRAHAEIEFGPDNLAAIENWLQYWATTVERNESIVSFFRSRLDLKFEGKRVLDLGCGTAGLSKRVTEDGGAYLGSDFFEQTLAFGKAFTEDLPGGRRTSLFRASGIQLPLRSHSIDIVIAFDVIEHLVGGDPWQLQFLKEIARVLRPDGLLLLTTPNRLCPFEGHTFLIGPQFLPISVADRYIRWFRPQFFREYRSYSEIHLLWPWRMKSILAEAGLAPLHQLPWCTDLQSYRTVPRSLLKICQLLHCDWAMFYKFQIAAGKRERITELQPLKRSLRHQRFFQEPRLGELLTKGLRLMRSHARR